MVDYYKYKFTTDWNVPEQVSITSYLYSNVTKHTFNVTYM